MKLKIEFRRAILTGASLAAIALFAEPAIAEAPVSVRSLRGSEKVGVTFTVEGVVISEPETSDRGKRIQFYLQDESGGIRIWIEPEESSLPTSYQLGDRVRLQGRLVAGRNRLRLEAQSAEILGSGTLPVPREVSAAAAFATENLGRLVRVTGNVKLPGDFVKTGRGLTIVDRSGPVAVPLSEVYLRDIEFTSRLISGAHVAVVGIPEVRQADGRVRRGLLVRNLADFQFKPGPPYFALGIVTSGMTVFGLFVLLTFKRRQAEAHAHELKGVLQNLRKSQADLVSSETRYRALVENTADIVWETDQDLVYTYCSPNVQSILGFTAEEIVGKSLPDLMAAEDIAKVRQAVESTRETGGFTLECSVLAKDGRRVTMESLGKTVFGTDGKPTGYRGVDRDISARRHLEAELRQGQKMEAVGRLAGGIAHDFNNTLTVISACTSLLHELSHPDAKRYAKTIEKAVERSVGMTRQLLAFSRKQVIQPRVIDLNRQLKELNKMLRRLIGEDIEIEADFGDSLWSIKTDPGQVEQVVMNLVVNARDAMPDGGQILLKTRNITLAADRPNPGCCTIPAGEYVQLSAADTGTGMNPATLARIFEPFFTTKGEGKGTGLGLATVYGIVKQSEGFIAVQSRPAQGTTFEIFFPRVADAVQSHETPAEIRQDASGTVLLVEDEVPVRALISEVLASHGYRVLPASGLDEALTICADYKGNIDILLTDVIMPKANGPLVAAEILAIRPEVKVLYMSGYTDDVIGSHGVLDPNVNLIYKPFAPNSLIRVLNAVINGSHGTLQPTLSLVS